MAWIEYNDNNNNNYCYSRSCFKQTAYVVSVVQYMQERQRCAVTILTHVSRYRINVSCIVQNSDLSYLSTKMLDCSTLGSLYTMSCDTAKISPNVRLFFPERRI